MTKNLSRADLFVFVCQGSDCKKAGAKKLYKAAKLHLKAKQWRTKSAVIKIKCTGNCKRAPICGLLPQNQWLERADQDTLMTAIDEIIQAP